MDSRRLTPVIIGLEIFFVLLALLPPKIVYAITGEIAPSRTITIVESQPEIPKWKIIWDQARERINEDKFLEASELYGELLKIKPNIEAANWEYCKILIKLEDFSSSAKIIASLLEKNPLRTDYLLAAGMISLHQQEYALAKRYYGKIYESDPEGSFSTTALSGLVESLKKTGKHEIVFSLLEQLYVRNPTNASLLYELARNADVLGKKAKAKSYYSELLSAGELTVIDDRILFQASELFETTGNKGLAEPLWREYIKRNPNYLPFQQKLADFYLEKGNSKAALPHLIILAEKITENSQLLLQIAEIYLHKSGRPDKALTYYEKYLQKNPQDQYAKKNIAYIQTILANDYISIVENNGAWLLWRDLAKVTPNRLGIYLEMVTLLEKKEKFEELLEILLIIHDHAPQNDKITYKIVNLYRKKKEFVQALDYLNKVTPKHNRTKSHFLLKAEIADLAGFEKLALASYSDGLKVDPNDLDLRRICISRAGSLGMVEDLELFFKNTPLRSYKKKHLNYIINYFEQLSYNSLFTRLGIVYRHYLTVYKKDPEVLFKLQLYRIKIFRTQGRKSKAEELIRKLLILGLSDTEVLYRLATYAIEDGNIQDAEDWYNAFSVKLDQLPGSSQRDRLAGRKNIIEIKLLMAAGDLENAGATMELLQETDWKKVQEVSFESEVYQLGKELCWLYLERGNLKEGNALLNNLQKRKQFDPEIFAIQNTLSNKFNEEDLNIANLQSYYIGKKPLVSRLLRIVQVELQRKNYESAREHLFGVLTLSKDSLVGQFFSAELLFNEGKIEDATTIYKGIHEKFPSEKFFMKKLVVSEAKRGQYDKSLALLFRGNGALNNIDTAVESEKLTSDFEELVLLARMLWGNKQLEKSLKVYELLLHPAVVELLGKRFELKELYYHYLAREVSFWNSMLFLLKTEPKIVAELMAPPFLIENVGNETGEIVVEYYELYSWQKLIQNEYLARKAIVKRNYAEAKRNYKRLYEEENTEGLYDLASIYDRFGEYRKEAQVYEKIRNSGATSPELQSSIENTSMKIRPKNGLDFLFLEKNGRDGYVNLEQIGIGTSLVFTPDLEKDIKFQFFRNDYRETDSNESVEGFFLESAGTIELHPDVDFLFSGSVEKFDERVGTNFYYLLGVRGRLDDFFSAFMEINRKKVDDTLESITEGIYNDGFEIGLIGETSFGLLFAGDYRHRKYSDGNSQNMYHGNFSYNIYRETLQFGFRYDYQYLENSNDNEKSRTGEENETRKLYWKPDNYNEHKATLHFQQLIDGNYGSNELLSYYSFDNSLGYEDSQNIIYTGEFDIFLEMSPHYLLKGNFVFIDSEDYEEKSVLFSLFYRW